MPHLQTLTEFELAEGYRGFGLLRLDNHLFDRWFARRWQHRINEILANLRNGVPIRSFPECSRPCSAPADFKPWGDLCREFSPYPPWFNNHPGWRLRNPFEPSIYNREKNYRTFRGFPSDYTLSLLSRPLLSAQAWNRTFTSIAPWNARVYLGVPILRFWDPGEEKLRAEVFERWRKPKAQATGGRWQERGLYQWMLMQPRGPLKELPDRDLVAKILSGDADAKTELFHRFFPGLYRYLLRGGLARQAIDAEDIAFLTFDAVIKYLRRFRWRSKLGTWIYAIARRQATRFYSQDRQFETLYDYANPSAIRYDQAEDTREVHSIVKTDKRGSVAPLDFDAIGEDRWQYAEDSDEEAQKHASGPVSSLLSFRRCRRPNPEQECLSAERREIIKRWLSRLTPYQQRIIKYRYFDGRIVNGQYRDGLSFDEIGELMSKGAEAVKLGHHRAIGKLRVMLKRDDYFEDRGKGSKTTRRRKLTHQRVMERRDGLDSAIKRPRATTARS